jgi:hypothetical protein
VAARRAATHRPGTRRNCAATVGRTCLRGVGRAPRLGPPGTPAWSGSRPCCVAGARRSPGRARTGTTSKWHLACGRSRASALLLKGKSQHLQQPAGGHQQPPAKRDCRDLAGFGRPVGRGTADAKQDRRVADAHGEWEAPRSQVPPDPAGQEGAVRTSIVGVLLTTISGGTGGSAKVDGGHSGVLANSRARPASGARRQRGRGSVGTPQGAARAPGPGAARHRGRGRTPRADLPPRRRSTRPCGAGSSRW